METLGEPFVRGASREVQVKDFPSPGESVRLEWNQNAQHFEVVEYDPGDSGGGGVCTCEAIAGNRYVYSRGQTVEQACARAREHCQEYAPAAGPACEPSSVVATGTVPTNLGSGCGNFLGINLGSASFPRAAGLVTDLETGLIHQCN